MLLWLARHWQDAKLVHWSMSIDSHLAHVGGISEPHQRQACTEESVQVEISQELWATGQSALSVIWQGAHWGSEEGVFNMGPQLQRLLRLAVHIPVLYLYASNSFALPTMDNLKHLVMFMRAARRGWGLPSFQHLIHLETLQLGSTRPWVLEAYLHVPVSLKLLAFDSFAPHGINMAEGCRISIKGDIQCVEEAVHGLRCRNFGRHLKRWCGKTKNSIRDLSLVIPPCDEFEPFVREDLLLYGRNLEAFTLHWRQGDVLHDVLLQSLPEMNLAHLVSLHLVAGNLSIALPCTLQLVSLDVVNLLSVSFEDPKVSATHVRSWTIKYSNFLQLGGGTGQLKAFEAGLALRQMTLSYHTRAIGHDYVVTSRAVHASEDVKDWERVCLCKCCRNCLQLPGKSTPKRASWWAYASGKPFGGADRFN